MGAVRKPAAAVGWWESGNPVVAQFKLSHYRKSRALAFCGISTFPPPAFVSRSAPYQATSMSAAYFVLVRKMRDGYNHRLRLVQSARQRGIKPTARLFQTTVPTVRKWLRRYQQQGSRGLIERSRAPQHQPGKTPLLLEQQVVALRQQLPTFGARRLIREVRSLPQPSRPGTHLARARPAPAAAAQVSTQAGSGSHQGHLAPVPADLRRYQRPRRYPPLLAAVASARSSRGLIHRPRRAQWLVLLGLRTASFRGRQFRLCRAHSKTPRALRSLLTRPGLANRQWLGVRRQLRSPGPPHRLPRCFRRQPARAHPARGPHLSERR